MHQLSIIAYVNCNSRAKCAPDDYPDLTFLKLNAKIPVCWPHIRFFVINTCVLTMALSTQTHFFRLRFANGDNNLSEAPQAATTGKTFQTCNDQRAWAAANDAQAQYMLDQVHEKVDVRIVFGKIMNFCYM